MKNLFLIIFITLFFVGCNTKIASTDISKINGYWEIEKVIFPDGTTKEYTINQIFDYFEVKNNVGIRKKVTPQLDGTFLVNDDLEKVEIKEIKGQYFIYYTTFFNKWKEEIKAISDEELVVVNDSKNEYHYKRANPINLTGDVKKIK